MKTSKGKIAEAFHEVHANEPKAVAATRRKKGSAAAEKQRVAIALSKARAAGARVKSVGNPMRYLGSDPCYINEHK